MDSLRGWIKGILNVWICPFVEGYPGNISMLVEELNAPPIISIKAANGGKKTKKCIYERKRTNQ